MRTCFLFLSFIFLSFSCFGNSIDALKSDEDVIAFLKQHFPEYKSEEIHFHDSYGYAKTDSLAERNWITCDLDSNGETDLLLLNASILHGDLMVVLSKQGTYEKVESAAILVGWGDFYARIKKINGLDMIVLFHQKICTMDPKTKIISFHDCDTVVYKFGLLINYVANPTRHFLEKYELTFDCSQCETSHAPHLSVNIDPVFFTNSCTKDEYVRDDKGNYDGAKKSYTGQLTNEQTEKIIALLQYSDFTNLNNYYLSNMSDQPSYITTINYDHGKIKSINDNGRHGTYTLMEIYKIASHPNWTELK